MFYGSLTVKHARERKDIGVVGAYTMHTMQIGGNYNKIVKSATKTDIKPIQNVTELSEIKHKQANR